jgi:hypothetical protein
MSQVLTPEEIAALFEGMRQAEGGAEVRASDSTQEIGSLGPGFPEGPQIARFQSSSKWLPAISALPWLHL